MRDGELVFITDEYYSDFSDPLLMMNKETVKGMAHDRPCFFAFMDASGQVCWVIPISSQLEKYESIYRKKVAKYGRCDTIAMGDVLGRRKAFLIQNMCPVTSKYIKNTYIDPVAHIPVRVNAALERLLIQKASKILAIERQGKRIVFPDVLAIERILLEQTDE